MTSTTVDLAGVSIQVRSPASVRDLVEARLGRFVTDESPSWSIDFRAEGPPPAFLPSPRAVHSEKIQVVLDGAGLAAKGRTLAAHIDPVARCATVAGPAAAYVLDAVLRILLPIVVNDGLVLHGAMLIDHGRACVACGPSGAGKTTLADLAGDSACCDELVAVRRRNEGWWAHALPFWRSRPGVARLARVVVLEQALDHSVRSVPSGEAMRRLTGCMLWPSNGREEVDAALGRLTSLVAEVDCGVLAFAPRSDVVFTIGLAVA